MAETALATAPPLDIAESVAAARDLIEQTEDIEVVREAIAQADGWQSLLRSIGESSEKQNLCAELKLRAIRRAGELLAELKEPNDGRGPGERFVLPDGMKSHMATRWRRIGAADADQFEAYITSCREHEAEITLTGLVRFLPGGTRKFTYPPEVRENALELRSQGRSFQQIAEVLEVSTATVRYWLDPAYHSQRLRRRDEKAEKRKQADSAKRARELRKSGDPLGEVEPHLRKAAEALQRAVDAAEDPTDKRHRQALFPFVYGLEDALRAVMKGNPPRATA